MRLSHAVAGFAALAVLATTPVYSAPPGGSQKSGGSMTDDTLPLCTLTMLKSECDAKFEGVAKEKKKEKKCVRKNDNQGHQIGTSAPCLK